MTDLTSKPWIIAKGVMFLGIASTTAALILIELSSVESALLLVLLIWASCRFYYFLFYVLEHYVDSRLHYAGLWALLKAIVKLRQTK
jgi:hypothetical protein